MPQGRDEPELKYVHRVSAVAKLCGYMEDQLVGIVADVLQRHAENHRIREAARKAARKGDSLQELIDRVRVSDYEKQAEDIYMMHPPPEECRRVFSLGRGSPRSPPPRDYFRRRELSNRTGRDGGLVTRCRRCTGTSYRAEECYAIEMFCHLCRVKGHIQRACTRTKREANDDLATTASKTHKVTALSAANVEEQIEQVRNDNY